MLRKETQLGDTVDVVLTKSQDNLQLRAVNRRFESFLPVMKALHMSHASLQLLLESESLVSSELNQYTGVHYLDKVGSKNPEILLEEANFYIYCFAETDTASSLE